jgi:hypothetical protein
MGSERFYIIWSLQYDKFSPACFSKVLQPYLGFGWKHITTQAEETCMDGLTLGWQPSISESCTHIVITTIPLQIRGRVRTGLLVTSTRGTLKNPTKRVSFWEFWSLQKAVVFSTHIRLQTRIPFYKVTTFFVIWKLYPTRWHVFKKLWF